jgi:Glutaredoxin-like domain (DUF836)
MIEAVLYSKPGCCLCDDAKTVLERLESEQVLRWREVNILDDPQIFARYQNDIPVLSIDGVFFEHRLDEGALRRWLAQRQPEA